MSNTADVGPAYRPALSQVMNGFPVDWSIPSIVMLWPSPDPHCCVGCGWPTVSTESTPCVHWPPGCRHHAFTWPSHVVAHFTSTMKSSHWPHWSVQIGRRGPLFGFASNSYIGDPPVFPANTMISAVCGSNATATGGPPSEP